VTGEAAARNEALFRKVNERIEDVSVAVDRDDATMEFLCECDRPGCYERVRATRAEYEEVRATSTHFIVLPGHEDRSVEHVTHSTDRFFVVEKEGGAAVEAAKTDPRSDEETD
jgi:hypothetical protein